MNIFKPLVAATLAIVSLNASAAEWKMVSSSADEQVFVDSQSLIKRKDNLIQVRILENFARANSMGHGMYDHKSRYLIVAVDCKVGAMTYQQWSMHAEALGSGATVWADSMQGGPAFFRPDVESGYGRVVGNVCHSPVAMKD
jgi:hypothetical protein